MIPIGDMVGTWIAVGLTLMMFSFIYRDNPAFKLGEHLYLGISVGYYVNIQYWSVIYPLVIQEMNQHHNYWVLIPTVLGIFILLRIVPSLGWLSRMSFALYIGGAAGLTLPLIVHSLLLPQLSQTLQPYSGTPGNIINQVIILVAVFSTLVYFFFSLEHRKTVGMISRLGIVFIMISFGASFGYTVMGRISLLIGRFQFILDSVTKGGA
jgi:hypothetical protein